MARWLHTIVLQVKSCVRSLLPQWLSPPNLAGWLCAMKSFLQESYKISWSYGLARSREKLNMFYLYSTYSISTPCHATLLKTLSHKVTSHIKYIISLLLQGLWPLNMARWWLTMRDFHASSQTTLYKHDLWKFWYKSKTFYLLYHNAWIQRLNLESGSSNHKLTWPFKRVVIWGNMTNYKH